jgi:hypothetical protein
MEPTQQFNIRMPTRVVRWIDQWGHRFLTKDQTRDVAMNRRSVRAAVVLSLIERAMQEG